MVLIGGEMWIIKYRFIHIADVWQQLIIVNNSKHSHTLDVVIAQGHEDRLLQAL